jgi:hypothetical protein
MSLKSNSKQPNLEANPSPSNPMGNTTIKPAELVSTAPIVPAPTITPPPSTAELIKSLRLPSNFGDTLGVKKLLTSVPVSKPTPAQFFRCHPDPAMSMSVLLLEQKEARESYLVSMNVAQELRGLVRAVQLFAVIDRQNNLRLVPVTLPNESGTRNPWHESLAQTLELSKKKWVRIAANMAAGSYDVFEATGELGEPEWPAVDIDVLAEVAFRGKIVTSLDHPVVQTFLGKI